MRTRIIYCLLHFTLQWFLWLFSCGMRAGWRSHLSTCAHHHQRPSAAKSSPLTLGSALLHDRFSLQPQFAWGKDTPESRLARPLLAPVMQKEASEDIRNCLTEMVNQWLDRHTQDWGNGTWWRKAWRLGNQTPAHLLQWEEQKMPYEFGGSAMPQWGLSTWRPPDSNPITSNPITPVTKPRVSFRSLEGRPQGDRSLGVLKHWSSEQMEFRTCQQQNTFENGNDLLVCGHGQNFETSNAIKRVEIAAIKPKPFIMFFFPRQMNCSYFAFFSAFFFKYLIPWLLKTISKKSLFEHQNETAGYWREEMFNLVILQKGFIFIINDAFVYARKKI